VVRDQIRDLIEDPDLRVPNDVRGELWRAYTRVMSKLEPSRVVKAVADAAEVLSQSSPDLLGAAVVKDGDLDVLRLRR
ncbi:hypothetical protein ACLQ28_34655, partial [Micromonospora sp. DT201]|uniref:hypothetical protein n=1 Tax=Micromonospora sp. DT201 TaxID=3393442 RepID=UPI003CF0BC97